MFGITDYGAFCAAILLFLALPGTGTFALRWRQRWSHACQVHLVRD
jgi:hypothetical protein